MPGYTSNYSIPYPLDGDPVYQGAAQMEALAKKVDATMIDVDGQPGPSAYQVAVANGFVGSESDWLDSLEGEPGPPGDDGADGADGDMTEAATQALIDDATGGLTFVQSSTPPPAGTPSTTITFVA